MEELEPDSKVFKSVTQSAVNNLQGARLEAPLLLENAKDNGEGWDFYMRPFLHCWVFVYTFITASTIISDAHTLSPAAG